MAYSFSSQAGEPCIVEVTNNSTKEGPKMGVSVHAGLPGGEERNWALQS
jgi:hypothetical protein